MKFLASFIVAFLTVTNLFAQNINQSKIKEIEAYWNGIKTLQADFVQMASNGGSAEGKILIAKPNKIRMEYKDPTSVLIIGDGNFIIYNDKELDQVTHRSEEHTS